MPENSMSFLHSKEIFARELQQEGKSPNTINSYQRDLTYLECWLKQRKQKEEIFAGEITSLDLRDYENYLKNQSGLAPSTTNRRLAAVKKWTAFLATYLIQTLDIGRDIKIKKVQKQNNVKWLERNEVGQLLHAIEQVKVKNGVKGAMHYCIILIMANAGLRIGEVCKIRIADVDLEQKILHVPHGKGDKYRMLPLGDQTICSIKNWLSHHPKLTDYLFPSTKSNRITPRGVQHILNNYSQQIGIQITPHMLRHTFCKQLANKGVGLETIASLSGHQSIETTRIYVTPSVRELQSAIRAIEF
ncbi:tyrosine-type recombinase/integrase [Bacillus cereus]|uniref:tyrosine-type recombinase/integrase n=1 Tax=Bacillus cereus TaxID=1396 RepID=UPI001EEE5939|nr:tyrosine-type recombinase/integrase [Bacillus cereus]BCB35591.1 tyrosine recombinase XerC [Bacillus cereus]BCB98400.1 tyrosine recombinase XerC [Bacillus cereus]BCC21893.1 tyrosine recombinase XerC [Bacillus cereus]BCC33504.1 tyrosine recombinase XerC [Bacillus cereus]